MRIQHNILAMNAYRNYNTNTSALSKNLEKLSSGYKINRAGDDAAGLAISEKMRAQITGLNAATKNVKDGISLVKTAEGAMQEIQDMLNRMDYLATQSANGTYDNEVDRKNLQKEVDALKTEINRIADSANFNGIKLLDGSKAEQVDKVQLSIGTTGNAVAANNTTMLGSASVSKSAGSAAVGGAVSFPVNNFVSATGHYGIHPGTESNDQADPSFTIDLKDLNVKSDAAAGSAVTVSIAFAGVTLSVTVGGAASGINMSASQVASGIAGATQNATTAGLVDIGGVKFKMTATGSKITFELATAQNATFSVSQAASVNAAIQGANVGVTVAGGAGVDSKLEGNYIHGLEDVNLAKAEKAGELSGISLTLDGNIVKDGSVLKIGETEYIFRTSATGGVAATGSQKMIDVSGFAAGTAQYNEAARQMAQVSGSVNEVAHLNAGSTVNFDISLVSGSNVIHLDQRAVSGDNKVYTADDLKGMFSLTEKTTDATAGQVTVSAGNAVTVNVGDRFLLNDKVYTIVADGPSVDATNLTAASFQALVQEEALNSVKDALASKYDKFAFQVTGGAISASLKSTAVAGVDDRQGIVDSLANDIKTALDSFKVAKAGTLSVTVGTVSGSAAATVGDKFMIGDKTYTIVGDDASDATAAADYENTSNIKLTAADFNTELKKAAVNAVVEEAKKKYGDFNFTVDNNAIKVELDASKGTIGITDGGNQMNAIKSFITNKLDTYKLDKVAVGNENSLDLQIGDTSDSFNRMSVKIGDMHTKAMGTGKTTLDGEEVDVTKTIADIDISTPQGAQEAIAVIKNAINYVSGVRGDLGAIQNRLEHTSNNLSVMAENIQDAESTIRDTDIAEEMMAYTKNNILVQSAQAMLAQANAVPQGVLQLLG